MATIKSIQFKRGDQDVLETVLVGENAPKEGEPIFELTSNRLKIGKKDANGNLIDYKDLPYFGNVNDNLVLEGYLVQDATTDAWYKDAAHSSILVKWKGKLYRDITVVDGEPNNVMYYIANDGTSTELIRMANAKKAGLVKLYGTHGTNTDGAMTQKVITDAIDGIKFGLKTDEDEVMILEKPW